MTAEELNEFITDEGLDKVIADIVSRGYYVKQLATQPTIPASLLSTADIKMLDACGLPLTGARVTVKTLRIPINVTDDNGNKFYIGDSGSTKVFELNADGVVQIPLVKGARVVITVDGGFSREITVPQDDFDVLSYNSTMDSFIKPALPVELPIRRT